MLGVHVHGPVSGPAELRTAAVRARAAAEERPGAGSRRGAVALGVRVPVTF